MPPKKRHTFLIRVEVFDARVFVQLGGELKQAEELYRKKIAPASFTGNQPNMVGCCLQSDICKSSVIWFQHHKPGGGLVAHECLHAAFHILELSAIRPTADNHEPLAYLQEFLIRQIGLRVW